VDAGSYYVFGHGGCFGEDIPAPASEYDYRRPHQLNAATRLISATDPVKTLIRSGALEVKARLTPVVKESPFATAQSAEGIVPATHVEMRFYRG